LCHTLYSPFDRRIPWSVWQGEDCSYLPVFSGEAANSYFVRLPLILTAAFAISM
jgi:hypothetical protein